MVRRSTLNQGKVLHFAQIIKRSKGSFFLIIVVQHSFDLPRKASLKTSLVTKVPTIDRDLNSAHTPLPSPPLKIHLIVIAGQINYFFAGPS